MKASIPGFRIFKTERLGDLPPPQFEALSATRSA
jgi:hypothetical protein